MKEAYTKIYYEEKTIFSSSSLNSREMPSFVKCDAQVICYAHQRTILVLPIAIVYVFVRDIISSLFTIASFKMAENIL